MHLSIAIGWIAAAVSASNWFRREGLPAAQSQQEKFFWIRNFGVQKVVYCNVLVLGFVGFCFWNQESNSGHTGAMPLAILLVLRCS